MNSMDSHKTITTILFDAGGTLVHVDHGFLQRALRKTGFAVSRRAVREAECASRAAIDQRLRAAEMDTDEVRRQPYFAALLDQLGVAKEKQASLLHLIETEHHQHNLWRVLLPSTPRVLSGLRERGIQLGVVSNSDGRIFSVLNRCGIADFFQTVIDSHDVGVEKPDPRIFQFALTKTKARPEQTVYVGDIYSIDVIGAERAGLQPVLLDGVGSYAMGLSCRTIKHLRSLLSLV